MSDHSQSDRSEPDPSLRDDKSSEEMLKERTSDADSSRAAKHNTQADQNGDQNSQNDPTKGRRDDQLRRNDRRGQMGG